MGSVFDFARQVQLKLGNVDAFRMNKLVYYIQAWSLVWRSRPAFADRIEAWVNGPVAKSLWIDCKYNESKQLRAASPLSQDEVELVEQVLLHYGHLSSDQLIKLTHAEEPWRAARGDRAADEACSEEIDLEGMRDYYSRLWADAKESNAAIEAPPAFVGDVDQLERFLQR